MTATESRHYPAVRDEWAALPAAARRRLTAISFGWVFVAIVEATAYTVLALAIRDHAAALPVLVSAAVAVLVTALVSRAGYLAGARLAGDLYDTLGDSLAHAKLAWFTADHRALISTAAGRSVPTFMGVPAHQLHTLILALLLPLLVVGGIWIVSGAAAAALTLALLAVALTAQLFAQRRLAHADGQRHAAEQQASEAALELVDRLELLRTAAGPVRALDRAEHAWRTQEAAMAQTNRAAAPAGFISALASVFPLAGVLVALVATDGFADPTAALALLILTARASGPLDDLALIGIGINELLAHTAAYREVRSAQALPLAQQATTPVDHSIELHALSQPPALTELTAAIPEGASVHVAGPSGSGKSTLLGLMMRFDDPAAGRVTIGGAALTDMDAETLSSAIAYVPQDPVLFTGTLAENIRLGRPAATDHEVASAAHDAQLGEAVERHPLGINQPVGTHGQALSGGERQRIAIARALLKRAPILILDEATSALDEATERRIADALLTLDFTLVFVTHRDATIWRPDLTISLTGNPGRDPSRADLIEG